MWPAIIVSDGEGDTSMSSDATAPAGWYPDESVPGGTRWWDGQAWTENRRPAPPTAPPPFPSAPAVRIAYEIPDARYENVEVVGEAWREAELQAALGRPIRLDEEIEDFRKALLVPEPDNPHDPKAISVRIDGHVVGYIAKEDTSRFLPAVNRITASGYAATTSARIWAVKRRTYDGDIRIHSAIRVALPYDGISLPINNPPTSAYSLLPWGGATQITGEEQHFDHIQRYVPKSGEGLLIVTLHRASRELKSGQAREVVEVRVDGERVGELSTTTSRHFLPTIDHLADRATLVAAWARIQGSRLSAEIKVQGAKANELTAEWLDGDPTLIGELVPEATRYEVPGAFVPQAKKPPTSTRASTRAEASGRSNAAQTVTEEVTKKGGCLVVLLVMVSTATAIGAGVTQIFL